MESMKNVQSRALC